MKSTHALQVTPLFDPTLTRLIWWIIDYSQSKGQLYTFSNFHLNYLKYLHKYELIFCITISLT